MFAELNIPSGELPRSKGAWLEGRVNRLSMLEQAYSVWNQNLALSEDLFEKNVYKNPGFSDSDARQHRIGICRLMADGEKLALDFLTHGEKASIDVNAYVSLIDQKLGALRHTLHMWHGRLENQKDVPDSFKKGIEDIESGKVLNMECALFRHPGSKGSLVRQHSIHARE